MGFPQYKKGRGSSGHGVALFGGSLVAESANATNLQVTTQPGLSGATPYTLSPQPVVTAKKSLGTTDSAYVTNVVASLNVLSGSPVLSGTTTKTPVSGVATFTDLVVTGAGTWTLTFTSGSLASAVSSTGTTTSSSAATKLTITTAPGLSGSTPYTLSPQPIVAAQNGSSVTDTGYVTNVVAALNVLTGSPVLSGTTTKTPVSGVATFTDLVVTGAGTWTITFTSGSLTSATSSTGTTTSGGPTTYASATFTGADGALVAAETGGAWTTGGAGGGGTFTNLSNAAQSPNGVPGFAYLDDGAHSDGTWRCTPKSDADGNGVGIRGTDYLNCYRCFCFSGQVFFQKYIAGTSTTLGGGPWAITFVAGQELKVVGAGSNFSVYYNGVLLGTVTDSAVTTTTKHGIYSIGASTGSGIDDYSFKSA